MVWLCVEKCFTSRDGHSDALSGEKNAYTPAVLAVRVAMYSPDYAEVGVVIT